MNRIFLFLALASLLDTSSSIIISKHDFKLYVVDSCGTPVKEYGIACGVNYGDKVRKGDHRTPEGTFPINEILNSSSLSHDFHDGKGSIPGAYGPWFLRLDVPGYITIGIHGTHKPESIGTRATEGCIRMRNEDILELKELVYLGMPVTILSDTSTFIPTAPGEEPSLEETVGEACGISEAASPEQAAPGRKRGWWLCGAVAIVAAALVLVFKKKRLPLS